MADVGRTKAAEEKHPAEPVRSADRGMRAAEKTSAEPDRPAYRRGVAAERIPAEPDRSADRGMHAVEKTSAEPDRPAYRRGVAAEPQPPAGPMESVPGARHSSAPAGRSTDARHPTDPAGRSTDARHPRDPAGRETDFRHPTDSAGRAAETPALSPAVPERYSRQIRFAPIGPEGQRRLLDASVLIVGAGALGASLAQHMARAGVGHLRIVDRDFVERSNLQRQTLFDEEDARLALPKAAAAAAKLRRINSGIAIEEHVADVTAENAAAFAEGMDLVLDGTDNAATRLVLSDVCFSLGIPFIYGGAVGAEGMSAPLVPGETACLRCLIGDEHGAEEAGTCETEGVISPIVELVAALQAAEALKWLVGDRDALRRTWVSASLWPFGFREWRLPGPTRNCPVCGRAKPAQTKGGAGRRAVGVRPELAQADARDAVPGDRIARGTVRERFGAAERTASREAVGRERFGAAERTAARSGASGAGTLRRAADGDRSAASADGNAGGGSAAPVVMPVPSAPAETRPAYGYVRAAVLCGRDMVQLTFDRPLALDRIERDLERAGCRITRNPWLIRAETAGGRRFVLFRGEGRVLVQGASDADEAARALTELLSLEEGEGAVVR